MDHDQRMAAALQLDPDQAARIVRNIVQLDADATLVVGPLSERLMGAAVQAITKAAPAPWQVVEADLAARIVCPEWKMARGVGTGDAWLELTEIGPEEVEGFSWISVAVGAGPTRMALELVFRRGLLEYSEAAVSDDKQVAALLKVGMARDESKSRLFFPIEIQVEALAQAYLTGDFDKALAPVAQATKKAIAAKLDLDEFVGRIRTAAARK